MESLSMLIVNYLKKFYNLELDELSIYYLRVDIIKLIGSDELLDNDYNVTMLDNKLIISSIYNKELSLEVFKINNTVSICGSIDSLNTFKVFINNNGIINNDISYSYNNNVIELSYKADTINNIYSLLKHDKREMLSIPIYGSSLSSMGVKDNNYMMFELKKLFPISIKDKSLLLSIYNALAKNNLDVLVNAEDNVSIEAFEMLAEDLNNFENNIYIQNKKKFKKLS